jgi:hypothetical protein
MRGLGGFIFTILVVGLIGFVGYQIGVTQQIAAVPGAAPVAYPYYWHPFGFFGFGFFGLLFPLFFLFLFFGAMRAFFWGGWRGGYGHSSSRHYGAPSAFEDWHRRAHSEPERPADPTSGPPGSSR